MVSVDAIKIKNQLNLLLAFFEQVFVKLLKKCRHQKDF